nr:nuclear transport factor 2 family protein [Halobacterium sp. CBA1126]
MIRRPAVGPPVTDHEARVREYYDAVDADRIDDLLALFADDVVYDRPGQPPIEGKDALEAFYREDRPLEDGSHEVHDVLVDDGRAAVRGTFSGVQDGDRVEFGFADVHVFADGRIAERYTYTDRDTV